MRTQSFARARQGFTAIAAMLSLAVGLGATAGGCGSGDDKKSSAGGPGSGCLSTRDFFATKVYPQVFIPKCQTCHSPDGEAPAQGAEFVIQPASYPNFIDADLDLMRQKIVGKQYNGESYLLAKPLAHTSHGGNVQLTDGAEDTAIMRELVQRLQSADPTGGCADQDASVPAEIQQMDNVALLRRVSLQLIGRLPTADEIATVQNGDDSAFDGVVTNMMNEPGFYAWLRSAFNDLLLTDFYLNDYNQRALDTINDQDYPNIDTYKGHDGRTDDQAAAEPHIDLALAREPVELMAWIVRNGHSFGEVTSANYTVVNPYLAMIYNATLLNGASFDGDPTNDDDEWLPATVTNAAGTPIPHAGVLSSPMWLNRHNTSPTNRSRGRARRVMVDFLNTDILKIAVRPVDASTAGSVVNPTMNDQLCIGCHSNIDPIAGNFLGWNDSNYEHYEPAGADGDKDGNTAGWYTDMRPPGFEGDTLPKDLWPGALNYLGTKVAGDARFAPAMVSLAYRSLMGRDALEFPKDTTAADFGALYQSYNTQQKALSDIATNVTNANFDFKQAILGVIHTPYYKASNLSADVADTGTVSDFGDGRLLTPETLNRKVKAIFGVPWRAPYDWANDHTYFNDTDTRVLYGGIDSENVLTRATTPNGIMANMSFRIANDVACLAVPWDFYQDPSQRLLFGDFDLSAFPDDTVIRKTVVHLFDRILGETVDPASPEVDAAAQLFKDVYSDGGVVDPTTMKAPKDDWMPCGYNPNDGSELEPKDTFRADKTYTLRAWMAVVTYLMTDYRFLYE